MCTAARSSLWAGYMPAQTSSYYTLEVGGQQGAMADAWGAWLLLTRACAEGRAHPSWACFLSASASKHPLLTHT